MSSEPDGRRVAIVVPWHRAELTEDERFSLDRLLAHLGERDIRIVKPESLGGTLAGRPVEPFPDRYFESIASYSRLLLSADFYRRFEAYDFLLVHQLDSLVLSPGLDAWLARSWDYVGAPWLVDDSDPSQGFSHVGNGGFCLRRVEACLRVLETDRPPSIAASLLRSDLPDLRRLPFRKRLRKRLRVAVQARRGVAWYSARYTLNEDRFWSERARLFDPGFRIPPVDEALGFAFEKAPRQALELTEGVLPFGTHAWGKHDPGFWEPYLAGSSRPAEVTP